MGEVGRLWVGRVSLGALVELMSCEYRLSELVEEGVMVGIEVGVKLIGDCVGGRSVIISDPTRVKPTFPFNSPPRPVTLTTKMDPETGLPMAFGKVSAARPKPSANLDKHARPKQVSPQPPSPRPPRLRCPHLFLPNR